MAEAGFWPAFCFGFVVAAIGVGVLFLTDLRGAAAIHMRKAAELYAIWDDLAVMRKEREEWLARRMERDQQKQQGGAA